MMRGMQWVDTQVQLLLPKQMGEIYVASEGPCTHKELSGSLHLCTVSAGGT